MDEICAACGHEFGRHFTTHDGNATGCNAADVIQNVHSGHVSVKLCDCDGFVAYTNDGAPEGWKK